VVLVSAQGTATTKPFLAGPLAGVDEFDPTALALDRVSDFEKRTPAHPGSSAFWDSYCVSDFRSQVQSLIATRSRLIDDPVRTSMTDD
jgi:hypothetical protein